LYVAPVGRSRLLAGKLGALAIATAGATLCVLVAGLVTGVALFGWHPFHIVAPARASRATSRAGGKPDADRAYAVARRLRTGTVGHNAVRTDATIAFGGFKQSGLGREGGAEGLRPLLESKTILLDELPVRLG
jgi:hypothetical protein